MSALLPLILGGFVLIALLVIGGAWLAPFVLTRRRTPDPPDNPAAHGLPYEAVRFFARDGLRLAGWHVTGETPRPTIVLCPGHDGSMDGDLKHSDWLWAAGFDLLLFDWRAHGQSEGAHVAIGALEHHDLLGALDFLKGRGVESVGLMGFSMGGAVALRVAAEDDTGLVRAVVCDGGFARIEHALAGVFGLLGAPDGLAGTLGRWLVRAASRRVGVDMREADPLPHVGRIAPRAVLFIHGLDDPLVPVADQDALYEAAGEPKFLTRWPNVGHRKADEAHPAAYQQRVISFFKQFVTA